LFCILFLLSIQIDWAHRRRNSLDDHGDDSKTAGLLKEVILDLVHGRRRMLLMNVGMEVKILICCRRRDLVCDGDLLGGVVRSNMQLDLFHYEDVLVGAVNKISKSNDKKKELKYMGYALREKMGESDC
jgi:hypothetical protein